MCVVSVRVSTTQTSDAKNKERTSERSESERAIQLIGSRLLAGEH